jgi:hypothetical protein
MTGFFELSSPQFSSIGQRAKYACWPDCVFRLLAWLQFLHSGCRRAESALKPSAKFARHLSAEFARDSFNDSFNYLTQLNG